MHTTRTTHGRDRNPARNPNLSKASALLDLLYNDDAWRREAPVARGGVPNPSLTFLRFIEKRAAVR